MELLSKNSQEYQLLLIKTKGVLRRTYHLNRIDQMHRPSLPIPRALCQLKTSDMSRADRVSGLSRQSLKISSFHFNKKKDRGKLINKIRYFLGSCSKLKKKIRNQLLFTLIRVPHFQIIIHYTHRHKQDMKNL